MSLVAKTLTLLNQTAVAASTSVVINLVEAEGYAVGVHSANGSGSTVVKLQASVDGTNYVDIPSLTVTLTTGGQDTIWYVDRPTYAFAKLVVTYGSGAVDLFISCNLRVTQQGA